MAGDVGDVAEEEQEGGREQTAAEGAKICEAGLEDAQSEEEEGAVDGGEEAAIEICLAGEAVKEESGLDGEVGGCEKAAVPLLFGEKCVSLGSEVELCFVGREEGVVEGNLAVVSVVGEADDGGDEEGAGENGCCDDDCEGA